LVIQKNTKDYSRHAALLDNIGNVHLRKRDYQKAIRLYNEAWNKIKNEDEKYRKIKIMTHLGVVHSIKGNFRVAKKYLDQSYFAAKNIKAQDLVQENLTALSDYYAATQQYYSAYTYLKESAHLRDSIFTVSSHHIAEMQMRYETGKRDKENQILQNEIEIQQLELEKSNLRSWISYLSLVIVSMLGFIAFSRYRINKKANRNLEIKIAEALKSQEEQQQIIFHQASLSSLGELSAGIAHEINQPLQHIKLCTESIDFAFRDLDVKDSSIAADIAEIYQDIERINTIINHVRIFSSQQKNHVNKLFNIVPVVEDALSLVGKHYAEKGVKIELDLGENVGEVQGNPYKLEQIIINLLSNAGDALLEKEKATKKNYSKKINIRTLTRDKSVVLQLSDNGIGMTPEQKANIFRPFFTTKELGHGTGLGLSIVFGIIREFGGTISVTSEYLSGTVIEVILPESGNKSSNNSSEIRTVSK
jgi:C4-dicarboxylate-specific signal transduction histidine kinase